MYAGSMSVGGNLLQNVIWTKWELIFGCYFVCHDNKYISFHLLGRIQITARVTSKQMKAEQTKLSLLVFSLLQFNAVCWLWGVWCCGIFATSAWPPPNVMTSCRATLLTAGSTGAPDTSLPPQIKPRQHIVLSFSPLINSLFPSLNTFFSSPHLCFFALLCFDPPRWQNCYLAHLKSVNLQFGNRFVLSIC